MQQARPGRAGSIFGAILVALGILSLAYFASPIRLLIRETIGPGRTNFVPIILGGLALCGGIALLYSTRQRTENKEAEL
jgi:hypothetical protein